MNAPPKHANYRERCEWLRNQAMYLAASTGKTVTQFVEEELLYDPIACKGRDLSRQEPLHLAAYAYEEATHIRNGIDHALRIIRERTATRLLNDFIGRAVIVVGNERKLRVASITTEEKSLLTAIIDDVKRVLGRNEWDGIFEVVDEKKQHQ